MHHPMSDLPVRVRRKPSPRGFTLIELIVVIAIFGIAFFAAIPRFRDAFLVDDMGRTSRWIMAQVRIQREKAVALQQVRSLTFDFENGRIGAAGRHESSDNGEDEDRSRWLDLPGNLTVLDVELAGKAVLSSGVVEVLFFPSGYVQRAAIHLRNEENDEVTLIIEPFLARVRMQNRYVRLETE